MKIVITGVTTLLGRMLAKELGEKGHDVYGIDPRPWKNPPKEITIVTEAMRNKPAEEVFRIQKPELVVHMDSLADFTRPLEERYKINLEGIRAMLQYAHDYGVKRVIYVGRHLVYGANPDSSLYRAESDPPYGGLTFPELNDIVTADLYAASAFWRYSTLKTAILRIAYTLGPSREGTLADFLHGPTVPTVFGFDPLFQFMHEEDAVRALMKAVDNELNGIYNIAGPQPIPLSTLIDKTGRVEMPIPQNWYTKALGRLGFSSIMPRSVDHVRYSVVIDDKSFRDAIGFMHEFDETETMQAFRYPPKR